MPSVPRAGRRAPATRSPSPAQRWLAQWPAEPALAKPLPRQLCAGAEPQQLGFGDIAPHRRHAAIGGRNDIAPRHELCDIVEHLADVFRGLHRVAGDVDDAGLHDLALEQAENVERYLRIAALDRDLLDRAFGDRRKDLLVLPPLAAQRLFPDGVGLDAV